MSAKPVLDFKSKKEARAAIREIAWRYATGEEFFDPLLQRLFVEHRCALGARASTVKQATQKPPHLVIAEPSSLHIYIR
jgi:hypothetical protein